MGISVRLRAFTAVIALATIIGCETAPEVAEREAISNQGDAVQMTENGEPSHITVQHCLIGFAGSVPGKGITRSKDEAATLAAEILEKAKKGEDFDELVRTHTDDSPPGIYKMANTGFPGNPSRDVSKAVFERGGMVPAFGDVGFTLKVGEFGMSQHSADKSPYGWHIIKRVE
ncbi:MAG: peptidylprolyl isomerase [Mariniblastus sp.]